jgi:hypothetical protein
MTDRLPLLLSAALLLIAGGIRIAQAGGEGWAFLALGAVALGAWIALEAHNSKHDGGGKDDPR